MCGHVLFTSGGYTGERGVLHVGVGADEGDPLLPLLVVDGHVLGHNWTNKSVGG